MARGRPPEFFRDCCEVGLVLGDVGAFGQVLTDQPVCVLVTATFLWGTRVSEVHRQVGGHGQRGMPSHLGSLVPGQRSPHQIGKPGDVVDQMRHTPRLSPSPFGRARIVTNRVLRSTRVIAALAPRAPMIRSASQ